MAGDGSFLPAVGEIYAKGKPMLKIRVLLCLVLISGLGWFTDGETQEPGTLVRIAGGGEQEGEDIPAVDLKLELPLGLAIDPGGNMYIAELGGHRVRRVDAVTGRATTVAGTGKAGFSGDGAPATDAQLNGPQGVAVDSLGNLYIADTGNRRIRKVDAATGIITTIAGTGVFGFGGDGGVGTVLRRPFPRHYPGACGRRGGEHVSRAHA